MDVRNSYGAGLSPLMSVEAKKNVKDDRFPEVLFGEPFYYFLDHMRNLKSDSVLVYKRRLAEFLIHHKSTTVDFYKYVIENENPKDSRDKDVVRKLLDNYLTQLMTREEKPFMFNTVLTYVYAFNHFLEGNDKSMGKGYSFKPPKIFTAEEYKKKVVPDGAYRISREKINEMMALTANPQYRSMLLTMKDTGLRSSDLTQIQYKHIRKALADPAPDYITFEILPIKNMNGTNLIANPVMGPDSIKALRAWFIRKKKKFGQRYEYEKKLLKKAQTWKMYDAQKDLVPKEYPYTENDEDYVYCYMETKKTYTRTDGLVIPGRSFGEPLRPRAVTGIVNSLKRDNKEAFYKISSHSFRKSHTTGLTAGGVPERWQNVMQGKKGEGTQGIYQKPDEAELIEAYSEGYEQISLAEPKAEHITELENKIDTLERIVMKNLLQRENWEALRNPPA